jgi:hypothetical protein
VAVAQRARPVAVVEAVVVVVAVVAAAGAVAGEENAQTGMRLTL